MIAREALRRSTPISTSREELEKLARNETLTTPRAEADRGYFQQIPTGGW